MAPQKRLHSRKKRKKYTPRIKGVSALKGSEAYKLGGTCGDHFGNQHILCHVLLKFQTLGYLHLLGLSRNSRRPRVFPGILKPYSVLEVH